MSAWTPQEDAIMRRHYQTGGPRAVREAGVNRSPNAIIWRANHVLGLGNRADANPKTHRHPRNRVTPAQAAVLRQLAERDDLLDQDDSNPHVLHNLARKGWARHEGDGLWRITLAGLEAHRRGKE